MNKYLLSAATITLLSAGVYSVAQESGTPEGQESTFAIVEFTPADGSVVKAIESVRLGVRMEGEATPMINMERISEITLTSASGVTIKAVSSDEPGFKEPDILMLPVSFGEPVTESGTYTLSVPAGVIYEAVWDNSADAFVGNGRVNEAASITITVDASAKSPIMDYTLIPASGSKLTSLSGLKLIFNSYGPVSMIQANPDGCVISNGTTEYGVLFGMDWSGEYEGKSFNVFIVDGEGEDVEITEDGEWTLVFPAGAFTYENEVSEEITATYTIGKDIVPDYKWVYPAVNSIDIPENAIYTLEIPCEGASSISYEPAVENAAVTVKFAGEELSKVSNVKTEKGYALGDNYDEDFVAFSINAPQVFTHSGYLEVKAEAGAFTIDGNPSPELSYMVYMVNNMSYVVSPENGITMAMPAEDEETVNVTFSFFDMWDDPYEVSVEEFPIEGEISTIRVSYDGESVSSQSYVKSAGNGEFVIAIDRGVIAQPGKLEINADEGAFTVNGKASPAIAYSCSFGEVKSYEAVVSPAPETEVSLSDLKAITVSFPEAKSAVVNEDEKFVVLRLPGAVYPNQTPEITAVEGAEYPTFIIHYDNIEDIAAPTGGAASLTIDKGTFTIDGDVRSEEITSYWNVLRDGEVDLTWTASPEKTIVNAGYGIYAAFVFNEYESVRIDRANIGNAVVTFAGETVPASECEFMVSEGFKLLVNLYSDRFCDKSLEGELKVEIPEGCITVSGEELPAISFTWNVVGVKEYTYVLNPAAGSTVASLSEITIEFPEAKTGELFNENFITLRANDYSSMSKPTSIEAVENAEHATFKITFGDAPTKNGKYTLSLFMGTFTLDGAQESPTIDVEYTLDENSGVAGIEAGSTVTVYTLGGVLLHKDAPASVLDTLAKGIYVINGKKHTIR